MGSLRAMGALVAVDAYGSSMTVCGEVRPMAPRLAPSMGVSQRRHHVAIAVPASVS